MQKQIIRTIIFFLTLIFIYLAFPILIIPSSLPAIQAVLIEDQHPNSLNLSKSQKQSVNQRFKEKSDIEIYEISLPQKPTLSEKVKFLKTLHQQGMDKILNF